MKKLTAIALCLLATQACTRKKRIDDLAFRFCDKVTSNKSEYLKCFTDIVECHNQSSDKFDDDLKFIECARLFKVNEPKSQPFKYVPSINESDLDEEIWREIENLDNMDPRRKKKTDEKTEPKTEPKTETGSPETKAETKNPPEEKKEIARELPKEVKWKKTEKIRKEMEDNAKVPMTPEPQPPAAGTASAEAKNFDF